MMQVVYILLGFLATAGVVLVVGQFILAKLKLDLYRQEQPAMAIVLGSAVWSLVVFFLAAAHLIHKGVLIGLTVASKRLWLAN